MGTLQPKPQGGHYFEDRHASGQATRLALVEVLWGRLVDVHAIDADGATLSEPVLRDYVIAENLLSDPGKYVLETSPISQKTRLVVQRELDAPDRGGGTFASLVVEAARGLAPVAPRSVDAQGSRPFSFVARNAVLVLRFDDLLDDDEESVVELTQWVRVLTGYPPAIPMGARIVFDPCHGGVAGDRFHSTRVLIDLTVSGTEIADSPVPLVLNSLGLPRSERGTDAANVSLRLATRTDPGSGQFSVLRGLSGGAIDPDRSRPFDASSPTREVVRAMRAGSEEDPNNGFLLDLEVPRLVGTWPCIVRDARSFPSSAFDWELQLTFTTPCNKAPEPGDLVEVGERLLEVSATAPLPDDDGRVTLRARALNASAPESEELLGQATYQTLLRDGLGVPRGCWLRFTPGPREYPSTGVSSEALTTVRFSEPIDPDTALPFGTIMTLRGGEGAPVSSTSLIVGRLIPSLDLRELVFTPRLRYPHAGDRPLYNVRIPVEGGVTDLSGNELAKGLNGVEFTIDPASPRGSHASFVMRFDSTDELEPIGFPDVRGQTTYQFARGTIRPREVLFASRSVDKSNPLVSVMPSFAAGVVTPLSPLGSRLQTVWRYADLGWSIRDESKYNLDVIGLSWSPARGQVSSDFFEQFEILVAHSIKLPDEQPRAPITGGMKYPLSGLWEAPVPFEQNVLDVPDSRPVLLHQRALGYRVVPSDIGVSSTGLPIMPWPINRSGGPLVSFTWRDTAAIEVGGDFGAGVPLDAEVGPPTNLENTFGTFAGAGSVPTVGLPLLLEFRCFPSDSGIGLNPVAINLATNASAAPNFRAYSTGGIDIRGQRVTRNPDFELVPTGGFNPHSRPPGKPTARTADNSIYLGQLDYVIRISRAHTIWIDTRSTQTRFTEPVVEPPVSARPPGTEIQIDYRGADGFVGAEDRPFNARQLTAYGDPNAGSIEFHRADPTWKRDISALDGSRFVQLRFSFLNNLDGGLVAELSAVGVAYEIE